MVRTDLVLAGALLGRGPGRGCAARQALPPGRFKSRRGERSAVGLRRALDSRGGRPGQGSSATGRRAPQGRERASCPQRPRRQQPGLPAHALLPRLRRSQLDVRDGCNASSHQRTQRDAAEPARQGNRCARAARRYGAAQALATRSDTGSRCSWGRTTWLPSLPGSAARDRPRPCAARDNGLTYASGRRAARASSAMARAVHRTAQPAGALAAPGFELTMGVDVGGRGADAS